jgi:hypothetical protein
MVSHATDVMSESGGFDLPRAGSSHTSVRGPLEEDAELVADFCEAGVVDAACRAVMNAHAESVAAESLRGEDLAHDLSGG